MSTLSTYNTLLTRRLGTSSENFHAEEDRTSAINLAIQEFVDEYKPAELRDKDFISFRRYGVSVDTMEYATNGAIQTVWATTSGDAVAPTTSTDRKVGTYSGSFSWTYSGGTATYAAAVTSRDHSNYTGISSGAPLYSHLGFWLKQTDNTKVTSIVFRIGSDSSNFTEVSLTDLSTDDEWNYYKLSLSEGTETGTPNWTAVDYFAMVITETATSSILLDDVRVIPQNQDYMVGTLPSDVSTPNRILKMENTLTGATFTFMDPEEFFRRGSSSFFAYDYSIIDAAMMLFLHDTTQSSLLSHHVKDPTTLSASSDDSGLTAKSDEIIALLALRRLLIDAGDLERGEILYQREMKEALATWQGQYGRNGRRLKSRYEIIDFHSR